MSTFLPRYLERQSSVSVVSYHMAKPGQFVLLDCCNQRLLMWRQFFALSLVLCSLREGYRGWRGRFINILHVLLTEKMSIFCPLPLNNWFAFELFLLVEIFFLSARYNSIIIQKNKLLIQVFSISSVGWGSEKVLSSISSASRILCTWLPVKCHRYSGRRTSSAQW